MVGAIRSGLRGDLLGWMGAWYIMGCFDFVLYVLYVCFEMVHGVWELIKVGRARVG